MSATQPRSEAGISRSSRRGTGKSSMLMGRGSLVNRGGCARGEVAELAAPAPDFSAGSHGRSRASAAEKSFSSHHSRSEPDRESSPARTQTQSVASPLAWTASASCLANRSLSPASGATRIACASGPTAPGPLASIRQRSNPGSPAKMHRLRGPGMTWQSFR
jgi:hypothetical protein